MDQLPQEIILNILDFIQDDQASRKCFATINKELVRTLLRKVVRIEISLGALMELNEQRRINLLKRSESFYFYDNPNIPLTIDLKRAYLVQTKRVELLLQLERVHMIRVYMGSNTDILRVISEKTKQKSLSVQEVSLVEGELEEIAVIEGLEALKIYNFHNLKIEGLNIHAYRSLKTVLLEDCGNIADVSRLDGIYDLTLRNCSSKIFLV